MRAILRFINRGGKSDTDSVHKPQLLKTELEHAHTHARTHARTRARAHTHTHTHTHTVFFFFSLSRELTASGCGLAPAQRLRVGTNAVGKTLTSVWEATQSPDN